MTDFQANEVLGVVELTCSCYTKINWCMYHAISGLKRLRLLSTQTVTVVFRGLIRQLSHDKLLQSPNLGSCDVAKVLHNCRIGSYKFHKPISRRKKGTQGVSGVSSEPCYACDELEGAEHGQGMRAATSTRLQRNRCAPGAGMEESPQAIPGPHIPYHRKYLCLLWISWFPHTSE